MTNRYNPSEDRRPIFDLIEDDDEDDENRRNLVQCVEEAARQVLNSSTNSRRRNLNSQTASFNQQYNSITSSTGSSKYPILGVKGDEFFEPSSPLGGETGMVNVRRPVYSQSAFTQLFEENDPVDDSRPGCFDNLCKKRNPRDLCVGTLLRLFPFITMLRTYDVKKYLLPDVISGITTGAMRIPQSIAYALLARLTPIFGLYTAYFSAVFYFIFGGSNHMAAGAQGVISLMVGAGVERIIKQHPHINISIGPENGTQPETLDPRIIEITVTITFLVGLIQMALGILRLGFVTNYLSDPLIGGFTTGAASHVIVSQLPTILGIKIDSHSGNFNMIFLIIEIFEHIAKTNVATFLISLVCFVFLSACKYLNDKLGRRLKIPIPGELIILAATIGFSELTQAHTRWSVKVVGPVPSGFETPRLPAAEYMSSALGIAFPAAIVSFAIGYSISKRLALLNDYDIHGNQEVFAFGFMNSASSFFNCFTTTASMSVSSLHESLGGRTQIANLIASILVLLTLLFVGPIFKPTPECVLSIILIVNLKSILFQFFDLRPLWKVSRIDFLLWIVTWLAVIILDVDIGLGLGVAFSLFTIVFRTQWPYTCILGRIEATDIYKNRSVTPNAHEIPGIRIFRCEGSLYFASAEHFKNSLYKETECNPVTLMRLKNEFEEKLVIVKQKVQESLIRIASTASANVPDHIVNTSEDLERLHLQPPTDSTAFRPTVDNDRLIDIEEENIHHIVLDFSVCSFIDSVGVRALTQIVQEYYEVGIGVFLANVRAHVRTMLMNSEAQWGASGPEMSFARLLDRKIFVSVHDAVLAALEEAQKMEEREHILRDAGRQTIHVTRQHSLCASDVD